MVGAAGAVDCAGAGAGAADPAGLGAAAGVFTVSRIVLGRGRRMESAL